jgi:hypothetical protein
VFVLVRVIETPGFDAIAADARPRRDWAPWLSAGVAAFAASFVLSPGWPAIAGALVGCAVGMFTDAFVRYFT